jgi:hypothetical protein
MTTSPSIRYVVKLAGVAALSLGGTWAQASSVDRASLPVGLTTEAACGCSGRSDCTCKKGTCKCSKCGAHKVNTRIIETLKNTPVDTRLPATARLDATAGVFI